MKLSLYETTNTKKDSQIKSPSIDALMLSPGAISPLQLADTSVVPQRTTTKHEISELRHLEDGILDLFKKQIAQQNKIIESLKSENDVVYDYDWTRMEPGTLL
jgi:type II secretory pathway predicted ATPase ExeA